MDRLKAELKTDKFDLLNKLLDQMEILDYKSLFAKKISLNYKFLPNNKIFGVEKKSFNVNASLNLERGCHFEFKTRKNQWADDESINLVEPSFEGAIILEQIIEEVSQQLDEYTAYLESKETEVDDYVKQLRVKFVKELILLKLNKKGEEN